MGENTNGLHENCKDLKAVKVNTEIWSQLSATKRKTDLQLANMQQLTRKIAFANLQTTNWLLSQPPGTEVECKAICSAEIPADSKHLFGDDLARQLKDASHNVTHTTIPTKLIKENTFCQGQRDSHHGKGQRNCFLWQGHYRP